MTLENVFLCVAVENIAVARSLARGHLTFLLSREFFSVCTTCDGRAAYV